MGFSHMLPYFPILLPYIFPLKFPFYADFPRFSHENLHLLQIFPMFSCTLMFVARGPGSATRALRIKGIIAVSQARVDAAGATASAATSAHYPSITHVGTTGGGLVAQDATQVKAVLAHDRALAQSWMVSAALFLAPSRVTEEALIGSSERHLV